MQTDFCVSSCPQQLQSLCNGLCQYTNCFYLTFQANCPRRITPTPAFPVTDAVSHQHLICPSCFFADEGFYLTGFVFASAQRYPLKCNLRLSIYVHFWPCALQSCPFKNHLLCVVCIQVINVHPKTIHLVWCVYGSSLFIQKPSTLCCVYIYRSSLSIQRPCAFFFYRPSLSFQKPSTLCGVYTGCPYTFKNHLPCVVCIQVVLVRSKTIYLVWCVYRSSLSIQKPSTLCGMYTDHPCLFKNHLPCVVCIQVIPVCSKTIYLVWCVYRSHLSVKNHLPCVVCSSVHQSSLSVQKNLPCVVCTQVVLVPL